MNRFAPTFVVLFFLSNIGCAAPGDEVTNIHCVEALRKANAPSVAAWVGPRFSELENQGFPLSVVARILKIPENYLREAMDGSRKNLGTIGTRKIQAFLQTFPRQAPAPSPTLDRALDWIKKDSKFDARPLREKKKYIYNWAPEVPPVAEPLKSQTDTIEKAAKHYLSDVQYDTVPYPPQFVGKIGNRIYRTDDHPRERFFTTKFKPPAGLIDTKVYLNLSQESVGAELSGLVQKAEASGAHALKFNGLSTFNMADRAVVYFSDPLDALSFSRQIAADLHQRGITGGPIPFAFQVGSSGTSPVAISRDPEGGNNSWRGLVSDVLAEAYELIPAGPQRNAMILRYLKSKGIDTDFWLPSDYLENYRTEIEQLRTSPF